MTAHEVDIVIVGGSMGGVAAYAHAAADGLRVLLITEYEWLGGQWTTQGVSAPDEHPYIETFTSASYAALRRDIRQTYIEREGAPPVMAHSVLGPHLPLNPGNGWVSRLCCLPERAAEVMERAVENVWRSTRVTAAAQTPQGVLLTVQGSDGTMNDVLCRWVLDATDTGDLLPLLGVPFVTGAEAHADTGEPHAPPDARPAESQAFTMCFAVEFCPGEDHTIAAPQGYERFRDEQPYTLAPLGRDGQPVVYHMFHESAQGSLPFWSYRRLHDGALLGGNDIALINWISNDYYGVDLLTSDAAGQAAALDEARRVSLGFLHWLQTECPRDGGGHGYPELKLRADVMGSADGLAQQPYIRESRRIVPHTRIHEQDITRRANDARLPNRADSVGIGWYSIDLHPCVGNPSASMYQPTSPFQIPLGALIPAQGGALVPACKNIGTTHLTNGAYRLHPVEWSIGEAAGSLAAFCAAHETTPLAVIADPWRTWQLQARLVRRGCPIVWAVDVPPGDDLFTATQLLLVRGLILPGSARWHRLEVLPDAPLGDDFDLDLLNMLADGLNDRADTAIIHPSGIEPSQTWAALCRLFAPALAAL